jgi:hypothetical protein
VDEDVECGDIADRACSSGPGRRGSLPRQAYRQAQLLPPRGRGRRVRGRRLHPAAHGLQLRRQRRRHVLLGGGRQPPRPPGLHRSGRVRKVSLPLHCHHPGTIPTLRTNVLGRYLQKDFTLTLPDDKKITDIKWFAIYDLLSQNTFGDIYIPEEFEPPTIQKIPQLAGKSHQVSSGAIEIIDAKRIKLNEFRYDGKAKQAHFWVGVGAQPASKGHKVPDEFG